MSRFFATRGDLETFYGLFNGQDGDGVYAIGAFTRDAGTYTEHASNPVFQKTGAGFESSHVKDPWLMWDGSQYVIYYSGYDGTHYLPGRAVAAAHTGPWTRHGSALLALGSSSAFDDNLITFPTVLYEPTDTGREWKMWYIGNNLKVGYAYSSDGLSFTKYSGNPVVTVGAGGTWNDEGVGLGTVYKEAGTYYMFISGRKGTTNPQWQGGLVTFTNPEGTYTVYGSNPIFLARHNTANTSQSVTGSATVSSGATTVPVGTPGAFNVGEPVVLVDGNGAVDPEVFYLTTIGGATVTLDHATTNTFTGASVLRSFAYNSVVPRAVLPRASGGYEAFVAPFQPVEDLTVPASKLYEGSFEMRASSLTGAWTYNYVAGRGLLFPLVVGAAWHTRSAENPSVIAAP